MTRSLLLALLAALSPTAPALAQQTFTVPPPPASDMLAGPLDFCAEEFSVRLERDESMEWTPTTPGHVSYTMKSGPIAAVIARNAGRRLPPEAEMTPLSLPLSPVSRRRVFAMPELTETDRDGNTRSLVTFGIEYLLFGEAANDSPVRVLAFEQDQHFEIPFVDRIDPRPMTERRCTPSRSDPALARRIAHIPGGR